MGFSNQKAWLLPCRLKIWIFFS